MREGGGRAVDERERQARPEPLRAGPQALRTGSISLIYPASSLPHWLGGQTPGDLRNDPRLLYIWLKFAHFSRSLGSTTLYQQMMVRLTFGLR